MPFRNKPVYYNISVSYTHLDVYKRQEDTIHENEIKPQTAADKRKNWWDYHKVHVLLVVLAIAVVGYFIYLSLIHILP